MIYFLMLKSVEMSMLHLTSMLKLKNLMVIKISHRAVWTRDARKCVLFLDFPHVLQLQLKQFEYDFMLDTMVKINDR